jgi:hypothetical protein
MPKACSARRSGVLLATFAGIAGIGTSLLGGCYHVAFEQRPPQLAAATPCPGAVGPVGETRYKMRRSTFLAGLIGTARVDTARFCNSPTRTETKATAGDTALSIVTLGIYTPRHLYVTCPGGAPSGSQASYGTGTVTVH